MIVKKITRFIKNEIKILRNIIYYRIYIAPKEERNIVDQFHKLYYYSNILNKTWGNTSWLGTLTLKCPLDLWIYQEIIFELKPDIIIECGTFRGGSALFMASVCDSINNGSVITIDINNDAGKPQHPRIKYLIGSSTSEEIIKQCKNFVSDKDKVMVILDSDHHKDNVLKELITYNKFVTSGSYLIVEDTNLNGHPLHPEFGPVPGPMEAIEEFLRQNNYFTIDKSKEKFYLTFNPGGYLRKK